MKNLWITGAGGFLGVRAAAYYAGKYNVTALGHGALDIADEDAVRRLFDGARDKPDYLLHCAAVSDTGYAERHPGESAAINLRGPQNIARACAAYGVKLVYMSSDQVYSACTEQAPLPEDAPAAPQNVYGRDKLAAERAVRTLLPGAVGLRLSWLYDLPQSGYTPNRGLLLHLTQAAAAGKTVQAAVQEHRGVTDVWAVVERLERCFALPGGVYNFGSPNAHNSYETFLYAARCLALPAPETWILPDEARFAASPRNLAMNMDRLSGVGITFADTWAGFAGAIRRKNA